MSESKRDRAKQIRRSMDSIRRDLDEEVGEVEESARTLMNWRYYTENHPWECLAAATAIGYLVVPRRLEIESPDPQTLEKLARKRHLVVEQRPKAEARGGLVASAFSFVSGLVLKTVMTQFGHQFADLLQANREPQDEPAEAGAQTGDSAPSGMSPRRPH